MLQKVLYLYAATVTRSCATIKICETKWSLKLWNLSTLFPENLSILVCATSPEVVREAADWIISSIITQFTQNLSKNHLAVWKPWFMHEFEKNKIMSWRVFAQIKLKPKLSANNFIWSKISIYWSELKPESKKWTKLMHLFCQLSKSHEN